MVDNAACGLNANPFNKILAAASQKQPAFRRQKGAK
jgi:hypothetical protein